jgi:hypothetical protein
MERFYPLPGDAKAMKAKTPLKCKDCENWFGAEDGEQGPCMIKNMRGDQKYITKGMHDCDEGLFNEQRGAGPKGRGSKA